MNQDPQLRHRTLGEGFRDSFRAGPRAWYIAVIVFLCLLAFPFLGLLAFVFALLFVFPALVGAALGRLVGSVRERRMLRKLHGVSR